MMRFKVPGAIAVLFSLALSGTFSEAQTCSSAKTVWKPSPQSLCNSKWGILRSGKATHPTSRDKRYSCFDNFRGAGPVFFVDTFKNLFNSLLDYRKPVAGLKANRVVKTVDMFIEPNYIPFSSGRYSFGLRIGDPANPGSKIGAGVLPAQQNGSSFRLNVKRIRSNGKYQLFARAYSYHLNRTSKIVNSGGAYNGSTAGRKQYGQGPTLSKPIPLGEWVKIKLDLRLNDIGKKNGRFTLSMLRGNKVIDSKTMTGLEYRKTSKWRIIGPYMTDKYDVQLKAPVTAGVAYKNYRIQTCGG